MKYREIRIISVKKNCIYFLFIIECRCKKYSRNICIITVHVLMNGNERGVKGMALLAVCGTSMSKGFLDNGVPETVKGRNIQVDTKKTR